MRVERLFHACQEVALLRLLEFLSGQISRISSRDPAVSTMQRFHQSPTSCFSEGERRGSRAEFSLKLRRSLSKFSACLPQDFNRNADKF